MPDTVLHPSYVFILSSSTCYLIDTQCILQRSKLKFIACPSHITSNGGTTKPSNPDLEFVNYSAVQFTTVLYGRAGGWKSSRS